MCRCEYTAFALCPQKRAKLLKVLKKIPLNAHAKNN